MTRAVSDERLLVRAVSALTLILFLLALWFVYQELREIHWVDVRANLRSLGGGQIGSALVLTAASYFTLTLYEMLGLSYAGKPLPYGKAAFGSFVSYCFAHNVGLNLFTGGSIRYRIYSRLGLDAIDVAEVTGFCSITFALGSLATGGAALLFAVPDSYKALGYSAIWVQAAGAACLGAVVLYLLLAAIRSEPIKISVFSLPVPRFPIALAQVALGICDLAISAGVIYMLLPGVTHISYGTFTAFYVIATFAGVLAHVPGGLGVFEATMLLLMPRVPGTHLIAAILCYRLIYFIMPLFVAAALWAASEVVRKSAALTRAHIWVGAWLPSVGAPVVGLTVFMGGTMLLLSGAIPRMGTRLALLREFVPLPLVEASHLLSSLSGVALLFLANGLFRRMQGAYGLTLLALVGGIVFSLVKGFDYEEAIILTIILIILISSRRAFYRHSSLLGQPFSTDWLLAIAVVLAGAGWVGFFTYRHVDYSNQLWTQFAFDADAPRFLRASVLVAASALLFGIHLLMHPPRTKKRTPSTEDMERARAVIARSPDTYAKLAYLGDKNFLFSKSGNSFVMYAVRGQSWIVLGDPVGVPAEADELLWAFQELVDSYSGRAIFYQVSARYLPLYLDLGLSLFKLGEEARVALSDFSLTGKARQDLRTARNRAERQGLRFSIMDRGQLSMHWAEMKFVSDEWLAKMEAQEKKFSLGRFSRAYLENFRFALVHKDGKLIAFASLLEASDLEELSVDLMRHTSDAPAGTMDFLFTELMLWGAGEGYRWFSFGMAPFSGFEDHRLAPLWHKIGNLVFRHGEYFYNFEGLRQYKDKFLPEWRPKYLAVPGALSIPVALFDVTTLISGASKDVVEE